VIEFGDTTEMMVLLFIVIFVLNLLPAFAPPTWTAMSFIGLTVPSMNFASLAVVAATAATFGRITLAKLSRVIVRQRLLSEQTRLNIDAIKQGIEGRPVMTFGTFLAYSFSPLPSNYLFIAYGLTSLSIAFLAVPFFVGRLVSYAFWIKTASTIGDRFDLDWVESSPYFIVYFIVSSVTVHSNHLRLHADRLALCVRWGAFPVAGEIALAAGNKQGLDRIAESAFTIAAASVLEASLPTEVIE